MRQSTAYAKRWAKRIGLIAAMGFAVATGDLVTVGAAQAEVGLPGSSSLRLGKIRRDADGKIILDTSRAALREAKRERSLRAPLSGSCGRAAPDWVSALVDTLAPKYGLDSALVLAVIAVESNFQPKAISPKNAQGLMQLIPATAVRFGVNDPFNPAENVRGGIKYLRWLLDYFNGNLTHALAGYNAGEKAVDRYRGIPPYQETQHYVRAVQRRYQCGGGPAVVQAATAAVVTERPRPTNPWAFHGERAE